MVCNACKLIYPGHKSPTLECPLLGSLLCLSALTLKAPGSTWNVLQQV